MMSRWVATWISMAKSQSSPVRARASVARPRCCSRAAERAASQAGITPAPKMAPYCASKYGIVGMTESLNAELSGRGIHFSAICPGIIDTNIVATATVRGDLVAKHDKLTDFYDRRGVSPDEV